MDVANLAAANLTVNLASLNTVAGNDFRMRDILVRGHKKEVHVAIAFGDGALLYPTNGIPIPGFATFFLTRNLENIAILNSPDVANLFLWMYDRANAVLRGFRTTTGAPSPLVELTNSVAPLATTLYAIAFGW